MDKSDVSEQLLTAPQVAKRLQISTAHVYRLARTGAMPSVFIGRSVRFRSEQISQFIAKHQKKSSSWIDDNGIDRD